MKNYAHLIERKLLEAICEKLEIDHAAIVEPIRAEWKEAATQHNAEIDQQIAELEKQQAERAAAHEKQQEVKLCSEEERPRLEAKLRNLDAERQAAWRAWHEEDDPIESAKLQVAWEHLGKEEDQLKQRLGLVATR